MTKHRPCDGCDVCCYVFTIHAPELDKSMDVLCRSFKNGGCSIHGKENRPKVCKSFLCDWAAGKTAARFKPSDVGFLSRGMVQIVIDNRKTVDPKVLRSFEKRYDMVAPKR